MPNFHRFSKKLLFPKLFPFVKFVYIYVMQFTYLKKSMPKLL